MLQIHACHTSTFWRVEQTSVSQQRVGALYMAIRHSIPATMGNFRDRQFGSCYKSQRGSQLFCASEQSQDWGMVLDWYSYHGYSCGSARGHPTCWGGMQLLSLCHCRECTSLFVTDLFGIYVSTRAALVAVLSDTLLLWVEGYQCGCYSDSQIPLPKDCHNVAASWCSDSSLCTAL